MINSVLIEPLSEWLVVHKFGTDNIKSLSENSTSVLVMFFDDTWFRISKNQLETKERQS